MKTAEFTHMLDTLLGTESARVREQMTADALREKVDSLQRKVADMEFRLANPPLGLAKLELEGLVHLMMGDRSKIPAIKTLRSITGLGLKEAKDMVEAAAAQVLSHKAAGTNPLF